MNAFDESEWDRIGVCAWCGDRPDPSEPGLPVNFVVCQGCLERLLAAIPSRTRVTPAPRRRRRRRVKDSPTL